MGKSLVRKDYIMKLQGIKSEYMPKGKLKKVTINAASKSEFVEDLLDVIAVEATKMTQQNRSMK